MNRYTCYETKIASLMIGMIELLWSFLILSPNESVFYRVMIEYGLDEEWFVLMCAIGALTTYGAARPARKARHLGLVLSTFMWAALFAVFSAAAFFTPVTLAMPVFAIVCMLLLTKDAAFNNNRERADK